MVYSFWGVAVGGGVSLTVLGTFLAGVLVFPVVTLSALAVVFSGVAALVF